MWRKIISFGTILIWLSWAQAFILPAVAWVSGTHFLAFFGITFAALAGTLTLVAEHERTRRHIFTVSMVAAREPEVEVPVPRVGSANVSRIKRDG